MAKTGSGQILNIVSVGSYAIRAMQCRIDAGKCTILNWKTHRNELALTTQSPFDEFLHEIEKAIVEFKAEFLADPDKVHFMFSSSFMIVKILGVPGFARSELKTLIKDKLDRDNSVSTKPGGLDAFRYVQAIFEDLKEGDKIEESMDVAVLTLLAEKTVIEKFDQFAGQLGISLAGIWSEVSGTAGLIKYADPNAWREQVAIVNVGHTLTTFQIFSEGKCLFYRPIFTAGQAITNDVLSITNDETIDFKQAEELKHKISLNPASGEPASLTPLEALIHTISEQAALREFSLVRKLDISFEYLSANLKKRIGKIMYLGGTSNLDGLIPYIAKNTTLPPGELLDIKSVTQVECGYPDDEGEKALLCYSTSIGLAFAINEGMLSSLNLASSSGISFVNAVQIQQFLRRYLAKAIYITQGIAALFILVTSAQSYLSNYETAANLQAKIDNTPKIDFPDAPTDLSELEETYAQLRRPLFFYNKVLKTRKNWIRVYSAIAENLPEKEITLTKMNLTQVLSANDEEEEEEEEESSGGDGGRDAGGGEGAMGGGDGGDGSDGGGGAGGEESSTSIDEYGYAFKLEGLASSAQTIAIFAQTLKESGSFSTVKLGNVGAQTGGGAGAAGEFGGGFGGGGFGGGGDIGGSNPDAAGSSKGLPFVIDLTI